MIHREALATALSHHDAFTEWLPESVTERLADRAMLIVAARRWFALLPETCDLCKGTGERRYSNSQPSASDIYVCPSCEGLGRTYPPGTVSLVAAETGDRERAIAVLDALNQ